MRTLIVLPALLVTFAVVVAGQTPQAKDADKFAEINKYLSDLEASGFSGAVLLAKDGKPLLRKGIGERDRTSHDRISADTGFDIGSITKVFTSAAIFRLEQDGRLHVTDPLSKYFKDAPPDKAPITILQVLTHNAGLPDLIGENGVRLPSYTTEYDFLPVSRDEMVRRVLRSQLLFPPGSATKYSNSGYSLLAAIIEIASGEPYEKYVHDHIFKPASMEHTGYLLPRWRKTQLAVGYVNGTSWGTPLDHAWLSDGPSWNLRGNGGMLSNVDDLLHWSQALRTEKVLNNNEREAFYTAMGVKKNKRGVRTMGAAGGNDVFTSVFLWVLDEDRLVILFSNDSRFAAENYAGNIAGMMLRNGL